MSEANSLPIWLPAAIVDLTNVDPGTVEITGRTLTDMVDFIQFVGDRNGILGRVSRTADGWAGPVSLGLQRVDEIAATGRVLTFNAQIEPDGAITERSAGSVPTARIEVRRLDE